MGFWQDSLVYYRDFGYPNSLRRLLSMAHNVGDASAKTFAEYVLLPRRACVAHCCTSVARVMEHAKIVQACFQVP